MEEIKSCIITGLIVLIVTFVVIALAVAEGDKREADDILKNPLVEYVSIGYIDCVYDDKTGPVHLCGDMEVRCWNEDGGEQIECPTWQNLYGDKE